MSLLERAKQYQQQQNDDPKTKSEELAREIREARERSGGQCVCAEPEPVFLDRPGGDGEDLEVYCLVCGCGVGEVDDPVAQADPFSPVEKAVRDFFMMDAIPSGLLMFRGGGFAPIELEEGHG